MSRRTDMLDRHIGTRLKMRRILCGFSQDELAQMLGITFQQIQKYEKAINRVSASRLYEIAKILKTNLDYFYEGYEENQDMILVVSETKNSISMEDYMASLPRRRNLSERDIITILMNMPAGSEKQRFIKSIEKEIGTL